MGRALLLAVAVTSCSLGFTGEGYSAPLMGPPDAGVTTRPRAMVVSAGRQDVLLARFDERGELTGIEPFFSLGGGFRGGLSVAGDTVVAATEWRLYRTPSRLTAGWVEKDSEAQLDFDPLVFTSAGVLRACDRGEVEAGVEFGRVASPDAGVSSFEAGATFVTSRRECVWLGAPGFVMAVGGTGPNEARLASIEVAGLTDGRPGAFRQTTPLPTPVTATAATVAQGRLYVCGGYGEAFPNNRTDQCHEAPVTVDGDVGAFTELPRLTVSAFRGSLLRVRDRLHFFGAEIEAISGSDEIVFSLDLSAPASGWRRSPVRFPWGIDRMELVSP
jgi:hypothetical protein